MTMQYGLLNVLKDLSMSKQKADGNLSVGFLLVSSAKSKPPVLPGEIKSFSKNRTGELNASRRIGEKITSKYNRNGLAAVLLKYRRLKT